MALADHCSPVQIGRAAGGGRNHPGGWVLPGVKLVVYELCGVEDYRQRIRDHYCSKFAMTATAPWCVRKLVEQAVQYADGLGLGPHPDYRKPARVFGGVCAGPCDCQFTFGDQGKPFYRRGPSETEERARYIVKHLEQRCGQGNYEYRVLPGEAEAINRALEQLKPWLGVIKGQQCQQHLPGRLPPPAG